MIEGRWSHAMVQAGNCIYLIAGMSRTNDTLGSIEKFDPETKVCTHVGNLPVPVSSMTAAVIGSKIYVFGGKKSDRTPTAVIQYFDTESKESGLAGELPSECAGQIGRAVNHDKRLILVFRDGSILQFSDQGQVSKICSAGSFDHFVLSIKATTF